MRKTGLLVLILIGAFLQNSYAAGHFSENWVFLGISSVDFSTDYYDANSVKKESGLYCDPLGVDTLKV